jgi:hypothetical protein
MIMAKYKILNIFSMPNEAEGNWPERILLENPVVISLLGRHQMNKVF